MATVTDLMREVVQVLDDLEIPYFITGSIASTAFGEYRSTADVDIVARIEERHVALLCAAFPRDRIYIDEEMVRDAIRTLGQFNIIDSQSGFKADIMIPGRSPLDVVRFARARRIRPTGENRLYWFSSPEDVIIKKLEFYREGGSDKHLRDIASVIKTMGPTLDVEYIEQWATRLDVMDIWRAVQQRVAAG